MSDAANAFISRWSKASPSERANSQLFLSELCDLIGVPHPTPALHSIHTKNPSPRRPLAKRFARAKLPTSPRSSAPSAVKPFLRPFS